MGSDDESDLFDDDGTREPSEPDQDMDQDQDQERDDDQDDDNADQDMEEGDESDEVRIDLYSISYTSTCNDAFTGLRRRRGRRR